MQIVLLDSYFSVIDNIGLYIYIENEFVLKKSLIISLPINYFRYALSVIFENKIRILKINLAKSIAEKQELKLAD
jgi:hypothetical protein